MNHKKISLNNNGSTSSLHTYRTSKRSRLSEWNGHALSVSVPRLQKIPWALAARTVERAILFEAIASCYCDIYRLQVFRGIEHEDVHKRAAFLMRWISKFRPIQICTDKPTNLPTAILANEIFAVEIAMIVLNIDPDILFRNSQLNGYAKNLVYLLRFHSCGAEQVASELFLLDKHARSNWSAMT